MLSWFQTSTGSWHLPSILALVGWLATSATLFATLKVNADERERNGPWKLSSAQVQQFSAALNGAPRGHLAIEYIALDATRSQPFADKLREMLGSAGYNVWGYIPAFQQTGNVAPLVGIRIGTKAGISDSVGGPIQHAFETIGITTSHEVIMNNNYADDFVVILVGIKP